MEKMSEILLVPNNSISFQEIDVTIVLKFLFLSKK